MFSKKPDAVIAYSPPLTLGITTHLIKLVKNTISIVNIQDLFPQSAIDLGILKNEFLIKIYEVIERWVYKRNTYIVVHSENNASHISLKSKNIASVKVFNNYLDVEKVAPGPRQNAFSARFEISEKFVVSFAGVLGKSQDIDIVLQAAAKLRHEKNIKFLIAGDGTEQSRAKSFIEQNELENVLLLPMQPVEEYILLLRSSDIGLVTLSSKVDTPVVPSKLLSIMSAGIPVIASLPEKSDAIKIIQDADCGICIQNQDSNELAAEIKNMSNRKDRLEAYSSNGRAYALNHFSVREIAKEYVALCESEGALKIS